LIDITELLIQHVHIITAIPTSFINQLRRFNDIKMADNSKKFFGFLRRGSGVQGTAAQEEESLIAKQLRSTIPNITFNNNADERTQIIRIEEEGQKERCEQIVFHKETKVQDVINGLSMMKRDSAIIYESKGNLIGRRKLRSNATLNSIVKDNPKVQFVLCTSKE